MHVIVRLLAGCQSAILSSNEWHDDMNPAFISTITAPNFQNSGIPKQRGTKSELAASALPSWGPKRGQKCYFTPTFSGVPNKGDKIRSQNLREG